MWDMRSFSQSFASASMFALQEVRTSKSAPPRRRPRATLTELQVWKTLQQADCIQLQRGAKLSQTTREHAQTNSLAARTHTFRRFSGEDSFCAACAQGDFWNGRAARAWCAHGARVVHT